MVGIFAPNLPEYAVAYLGVALAGGTSTTDQRLYTAGEVAHQLRSSGARFLFTVGAMLDRGAARGRRGRAWRRCSRSTAGAGTTALADVLGRRRRSWWSPALDPATALVALPYSSGTTGFAKGVMLTHRNMVANVMQTDLQVPTEERRGGRGRAAVLPHLRPDGGHELRPA